MARVPSSRRMHGAKPCEPSFGNLGALRRHAEELGPLRSVSQRRSRKS